MVRLMPGMLRYYWETRHENDTFWGPSSGAGYTYSHLWPEGMAEWYLRESRRLLDQTGQNGCNLVNWNLQDWWREVEDDEAVRREQEIMASAPGLVCGLGGSPYAKSYPTGPTPKLHSVHIANVGRENIADIVRFSRECPTRPLFMFLFAQIEEGIWQQLESETPLLEAHPEIELLGMDAFFLTLRDAVERGMVTDTLYEKTDELAETWLRGPGRNRLPYCDRLARELADLAEAEPSERRRRLAHAGWIDLVSREIEHVARDREAFLGAYAWRDPVDPDDEPDTLLYVAFTVTWTVVRSVLESRGFYANNRFEARKEFRAVCRDVADPTPFEEVFAAWDRWEDGPTEIGVTARLAREVARATSALAERFGPDEERAFEGWLPRPI
jgi:hypothetical protein